MPPKDYEAEKGIVICLFSLTHGFKYPDLAWTFKFGVGHILLLFPVESFSVLKSGNIKQ